MVVPDSHLYVQRYQIQNVHGEALVTCAKFSPCGKYIATCSSDKTLKILNAKDGSLHLTLRGHTKGVSDLCWSYDSQYIASGSDDKTIRIWSVELGKCLRELRGHHYHITSVQFNYKANLLVSGSSDEAIRIWDVLREKCLKTLSAHSEPISSIDLIWDGTIIASASYDGLIRLFDTESGQCLKTLIYEYSGGSSFPVSNVKFSPNGKYILLSTLDGSMRLWDHMNNKVVRTFTGPSPNTKLSEKYTCSSAFVTLANVEPLVVSGSDSGSVYVWALKNKQIVDTLQIAENDPVISVDILNEGQQLVALTLGGTLSCYSLSNSKTEAQ